MRSLPSFLLLGFFLLASVLLVEGAAETSAFQKYYQKMLKSDRKVLELDDPKFEALIETPGAKRSFPVAVLFTASNPKYRCQPCLIIAEFLSQIAKSYTLYNARAPADKQLAPLIFAIVDIDTAPRTFSDLMRLDTVPHIYLFDAHTEPKFPATEDMALHLHPDDGGEVFLEELEERLGLVIEPIPDVNFTMNVAVCVCALVALAVYLVLDQWAFVSGLLWRRGVWLTFTYLVYGSGVGGMVYCVIRTPPPFGVSQRQVQLFAMRSGSEQFVLEGVVMGVINLMVGLSFVGVYLMACQRKNRVVQFVGVNLSLASAIYFMHKLFTLYCDKTRWYKVNDTLDPQVATYLFGTMKKSSGLLRRLLRVTQIWLYEFKDFPAFRRSATSMLHNFIRRQMGKAAI